MRKILLGIGVAILLSTGVGAQEAHDHALYSVSCCSGGPNGDCDPLPEGSIQETTKGWLVVSTGEVVGFEDPRVEQSKDGRFHRCEHHLEHGREFRGVPLKEGDTRCLYVPGSGT